MACTYYRYNGGWFSGDYWCDKKNVRIDDDHYYRYCRDYNYDECPIYKYSESSGCFITTVTCEILNHPDNNLILNILRDFRDNILQKDKQYEEILKNYDSMGPIIADCLRNDKENQLLAESIYKNCLIPISRSIINENYENAIRGYKKMTEYLIVYYSLEEEYQKLKNNNYGFDNYDQSKGGHGIKRKLKFKKNKKHTD